MSGAPPVPHTRPPAWPERSANRFASTIRLDSSDGCTIGLLGLPDDTGVGLNGGRTGAAGGPDAFRAALARYGAADPDGAAWPRVFDAGDVNPAGDDIHLTHDRVTEAAGALLDAGLLPVGIGGGHDLTFPFVRALARRADAIEGVYFDPHLDVREDVGSGMPFRALLELDSVRRVHNFGYCPIVNSDAHAAWFAEQGGRFGVGQGWQSVFGFSALDLFASFDLDVVDMAYAPGVSAMRPAGWTSGVAEAAARSAGACPRVRCFDIMELNPRVDEHGRTARLAAHLFLCFLRGVGER